MTEVQTAADAAPVDGTTVGGDEGPWRDDLVAALLATTLVFGLFLDGWNHINLQNGNLGSFFTIWHALLYAGFTATALWVVTRNPHLYGRGMARAYYQKLFGIPFRYPLAIAGLGLATIGLVGDVAWHTAYGTESGVARVIAPFHLFLFAGAALLIAAPLRSAWYSPAYYPRRLSFRTILPPLISLTLVTAVGAFMFQWLSAFLDWTPSLQLGRVPVALTGNKPVAGTVEFAGVARILVTNVLLLAPVLLALTRWLLPFGSTTFLFVGVATMMSGLSEFNLAGSILAALAGGLTCDLLIRSLRPSRARPFAGRTVAALTSAVLWVTYFLVLRWIHGIVWPLDLWLGTVGLATLTTVLLSFLIMGPTPLEPLGEDENGPNLVQEAMRWLAPTTPKETEPTAPGSGQATPAPDV
jgi:hypothetical protein